MAPLAPRFCLDAMQSVLLSPDTNTRHRHRHHYHQHPLQSHYKFPFVIRNCTKRIVNKFIERVLRSCFVLSSSSTNCLAYWIWFFSIRFAPCRKVQPLANVQEGNLCISHFLYKTTWFGSITFFFSRHVTHTHKYVISAFLFQLVEFTHFEYPIDYCCLKNYADFICPIRFKHIFGLWIIQSYLLSQN